MYQYVDKVGCKTTRVATCRRIVALKIFPIGKIVYFKC